MSREILASLLFCIIIISSFHASYASPVDVNVPPTRAFAKMSDGTNHVTAKNYLGQINITGGSGISVSVANGTTAPSLTITNTASSGLSKIQGSNLGSSGVGLFAGNFNASMLQFYSLISANSNCSISSNGTNVILNCSTGGSGGGAAPKVSINSLNRSSFTGIVSNMTFPAPKVVINGINSSQFTIYNDTINGNTGHLFTINNVTINGHTGQQFTITNYTTPAPKVSINGNNRSSFISVANTTSSNTINGHSVSFPSSNSGTLLLGNGSLSSLTGNLNSIGGTFTGTHSSGSISSAVTVTSLSNSGHVSTFPSNTGTLLQSNGSAASLTNFPTFSSLTNAGHVSTAPLNTGTILNTNGSLSSLTGTLASTLGVTVLSNSGHASTFPSNTGTLLQQNSSGTYLTNNVHSVTANSPITVNGSTNTVAISCTTCLTSSSSGTTSILATNQTSTSTTNFAHVWNIALTANSGNTVRGVLVASTNTAGGAVQVGANMSSVATGSGICQFTYDSAGTTITTFAAALSTTSSDSAWTTILSGANQAYPITFECAVQTGSSAPTLQINFQAEVASTVSIKAGSYYIKTP